mmetsp:Transcript_81846/g.228013  ORF Transcript_81846/g.228013 Transcript_81846/m.228013 type:complete len:398 (-) Transcript_81846:86-1279(-)
MAEAVERGEMKYVKFGNSDMTVSECCLGTMTWGSFNDREEQAYAQLDAAMKLGVNFIDTAELYPVAFNYGETTEKWIGNWLTKRTGEGTVDRSKLYIATKSNSMGIGSPMGSNCHGYDSDSLMQSCKASIERLQCSYIDLYQLHWPCRDTPLFGSASFKPDGEDRPMKFFDDGKAETFERQVLAVKALFDAGLIKHWGLSNENAYGITMFCMTCDKLGVPRPVSCQNDFSLIDRIYECDTLEAAHRFGLVGLPYGLLAGGTLTGKYFDSSKYSAVDSDRSIDQCRHRSQPEFQPRYANPMAMKATEKYVALAEKYGLTPAELAVAWANSRWYNGAIIIGTTTVRQVEENVGAFKIKLSDALLKEVDVIHEEFRSPCCFYTNKPTLMDSQWLSDGRSA